MKFDNVKVGDTVYLKESVNYSFNSGKSFFIPKVVTKVTSTQFSVDNGYARFKKDGRRIGESFSRAYFENENAGWHGHPEIVTDQSEQMNDFVKKIKLERSINSLIFSLKCPDNSTLSSNELQEVYNSLDKIKNKISPSER